MKKMMFLLIVIMISFVISGCGIFVVEENSDEYSELKRYYHQYLNKDFLFEDHFQDYINEVSLETSKSSVRIRAEFSIEQNVFQTKFSSGVIIKETETYYYILTTVSNVYISEFQLGRFQVTDYQGNSYTGILVHKDLELELATIRINKNPNRLLKTMLLSTMKPLPNEPMLLISYKGQIMNSMSMGFLIGYVKQNQVENMHTTIPSDLYGHGGAIINHNHDLVGIQYQLIGYSIAISLDTIESYIDILNQYIEQ